MQDAHLEVRRNPKRNGVVVLGLAEALLRLQPVCGMTHNELSRCHIIHKTLCILCSMRYTSASARVRSGTHMLATGAVIFSFLLSSFAPVAHIRSVLSTRHR